MENLILNKKSKTLFFITLQLLIFINCSNKGNKNDALVEDYNEKEILAMRRDINRPPYLQNPGKKKMTISWQTATPTISSLKWGTDNTLSKEIENNSSLKKKQHQFELSELTPGTTYYYQTVNDGIESAISCFTTFPEYSPSIPFNNFKFFVIGDSGTGGKKQKEMANRLMQNHQKSPYQFGLHVGDVSQKKGEEYDTIYFQIYSPLLNNAPIFLSLGNHDLMTDNGKRYFEDFGLNTYRPNNTKEYYSFSYGPLFIISLNSNEIFSQGSKQIKFLIEELNSKERKNSLWTILFFHHPVWSKFWPEYPLNENINKYIVPIINQYQVDIVFNGHVHGLEYGYLEKTHYFISGGGGGALETATKESPYTLFSQSTNHYLEVLVSNKEISIRAINENDETIFEKTIR